MSESRGHPAVPITRQSLFAVGALLKAGGYRSASQYISVAKQHHKEAGHVWGPDLDEARAQALRSINRGLGPANPKLDLKLESAGPRFVQEVKMAFDELRVPLAERIRFAAQACITACWFLLRGIELANIQARDITFNRAARTVKLQLPVSKTDPEAKGCYRVHRCICKPRHDPDCRQTTPPELFGTAFQQCSCRNGLHVLCVYHALLLVVVQLRKEQKWEPTTHLFRAAESEVASKSQVIFLARACAYVLQQEQLSEWGLDAIDRWAQHVFRVAGAQLFARSYLDVSYIQLLGRWGSSSVLRYVQEAAVMLPEKAAEAVSAHVSQPDVSARPSLVNARVQPLPDSPHIQDLVREAVHQALQGSHMFVHNTRSRLCHKPSPSEKQLPSESWVTLCGKWWYGLSSTRRNPTMLEGYTKCSLCFPSEVSRETPSASSAQVQVESGTDSDSAEEHNAEPSQPSRP